MSKAHTYKQLGKCDHKYKSLISPGEVGKARLGILQ